MSSAARAPSPRSPHQERSEQPRSTPPPPLTALSGQRNPLAPAEGRAAPGAEPAQRLRVGLHHVSPDVNGHLAMSLHRHAPIAPSPFRHSRAFRDSWPSVVPHFPPFLRVPSIPPLPSFLRFRHSCTFRHSCALLRHSCTFRHSCAGRNPCDLRRAANAPDVQRRAGVATARSGGSEGRRGRWNATHRWTVAWIPACAGMTQWGMTRTFRQMPTDTS